MKRNRKTFFGNDSLIRS